jgi:hypothetical protein
MFVADCRQAGAVNGTAGVVEVVSRAVSAPGEILSALGEPRRAGVQVLYRSSELTVLNLIWGPQMCQGSERRGEHAASQGPEERASVHHSIT